MTTEFFVLYTHVNGNTVVWNAFSCAVWNPVKSSTLLRFKYGCEMGEKAAQKSVPE